MSETEPTREPTEGQYGMRVGRSEVVTDPSWRTLSDALYADASASVRGARRLVVRRGGEWTPVLPGGR